MSGIDKLKKLLQRYLQLDGVNTAQQPGPVSAPNVIVSGDKFIKFKFIGEGSYGCVFSPPTLITPIIHKEYPLDENIDINNYDEKYVAKILSCKNNDYKKEFDSNMTIQKFDPRSEYTPKMIFAGYMNREDLISFINKNKNKNDELIKLYACLEKKITNKRFPHDYYGYIITTKVGKSFDQLTINDININNIKQVLTNLNEGNKNFINKLYKQEYVHGDIKMPNITLQNNKIYFIDFGLTNKYNYILTDKNNYTYPIVLYNSMNYNYPIILHIFFIIHSEQYDEDFKTNKEGYLSLLNTQIETSESNLKLNFAMKILITSHKYSIFKNIDDIKTYLKKNIQQILDDKLVESRDYSKQEIYEKCFLPIAKNVDIYSLSLVIFCLKYAKPSKSSSAIGSSNEINGYF
jgi:hypothetical protein